MSNARTLADFETGNNGEALSSALIKINLDYVIDLKNKSTGYLSIPHGNKQQQPSNVSNGIARYNSADKLLEFYFAGKWNYAKTKKVAWSSAKNLYKTRSNTFDIYFCGVTSKAVSLVLHTVANQTLNITANIANNKSTVTIKQADISSAIVNSTIHFDVKDGADILNPLFLKVI